MFDFFFLGNFFIVVIIELWECFGFRLFLVIVNFLIELFINCSVKYVGDDFWCELLFCIGDKLMFDVWLIEYWWVFFIVVCLVFFLGWKNIMWILGKNSKKSMEYVFKISVRIE